MRECENAQMGFEPGRRAVLGDVLRTVQYSTVTLR